MKREIKFRMWSSILKVMYYPNLDERNIWTIPSSENGVIQSQEISRIDPRNELMQCTGIIDSNGKEIYEGDIIKCGANDNIPTEIYWDKDLSSYAVSTYHSTLQLHNVRDKNVEIVGNIFENPELLERGQEKF
jgi:hypothetical protein